MKASLRSRLERLDAEENVRAVPKLVPIDPRARDAATEPFADSRIQPGSLQERAYQTDHVSAGRCFAIELWSGRLRRANR
jgi:hypothetical protein